MSDEVTLHQEPQLVTCGDFDPSSDDIPSFAHPFNTMDNAMKESYIDLEQRVAGRTKGPATLNAVAQTASEALDLETILTATVDKVLGLFECESGAAFLNDPLTDELEMADAEAAIPGDGKMIPPDGSVKRPGGGHYAEQFC